MEKVQPCPCNADDMLSPNSLAWMSFHIHNNVVDKLNANFIKCTSPVHIFSAKLACVDHLGTFKNLCPSRNEKNPCQRNYDPHFKMNLIPEVHDKITGKHLQNEFVEDKM